MTAKKDYSHLNSLKKKILDGLKLSGQRLIEYKIRNNEELVISKNGEVLIIQPEDFEKHGIGKK